jgi:PKD repeat protein
MNRKILLPTIVLAVILIFVILLAADFFTGIDMIQPVVGKGSAVPLEDVSNPQRQLAQELALADARVLHHTSGSRTEVFSIRQMHGQHTPDNHVCETAVCYQVEIYNFDRNATITAIVDVDAATVRDVFTLDNSQPGINKRLSDLAIELASNDSRVIEALGYRPHQAGVAPVIADRPGTSCDGSHLCAGLVYHESERVLWVIIDLTLEEVVFVEWAETAPAPPQAAPPFVAQSCPEPGSVERNGWSLSYHTSNWDGLRVHDVSYNGMPVVNNIKLAQWNVRYSSSSGFRDVTGCNSGGGGYHIYPYGETQVEDLLDDESNVIGFVVIQDFRMSNWGNNCNYRYEQHLQFFNDGRFRVVSAAFGRGCQQLGTYRPLVRIDIAIDGSANNNVATWGGTDWQPHQTEFWQLQGGPYTDEGYKWLVYNENGIAYHIEPGQGQFEGSPEPDNAYIYVVKHHVNEGDFDLPVMGSCCNDDHQQGPHNFVDGESIENENLVIWYVPAMPKNGASPPYSCWTVSGEPNPETYPCFSGPMFVPANLPSVAPESSFIDNGPVVVGETAVFTATSTGTPPLTYEWDLGDGLGSDTGANPTYLYQEAGTYTVALTTTAGNDLSHVITDTFVVLSPPPITATFSYDNPLLIDETGLFVPDEEDETLAYSWDFGDGITSTLTSPNHSYEAAGSYTVTLTITDGMYSVSETAVIDVGHLRAELEPTAVTVLNYDPGSGEAITITFPTASVTETTTLLYTALDLRETAVAPTATLYAHNSLGLAAYRDSLRLPDLPLAEPFRIVFTYDEAFAKAYRPDTLVWVYHNSATGTWPDAATTCVPPSDYLYEPEAKRVALEVCSLHRLALFGAPHNQLYLPMIIR